MGFVGFCTFWCVEVYSWCSDFTFFDIADLRWLPLVFLSYICCYNCSCHCVVVAVIRSLLLSMGLVPKKLPYYITIYCFKKILLYI